jgi:nucleolar MIF4G domain-containing protein 1
LLQWCGVYLRRDDAAAFKAIVASVQTAAAGRVDMGSRARFLVDSIGALKDNRRRRDDTLGELAATCRKQLSGVLTRRRRALAPPLRATFDDLRSIDSKGRWWLVGSAWVGASASASAPTTATASATSDVSESVARTLAATTFDDRLQRLAAREHMNTDVRRAIFCTVLDSSDFVDAQARLAKLGLSGKQEREIVFVLLHCVTRERLYNPFYAQLLARLAANNSQLRLALQYAYWDKFRELSSMSTRAVAHLARALASLLDADALRLAVLRPVEWRALDAKSLLFHRMTMRSLLAATSLPRLQALFGAPLAKARSLRDALVLFLDVDFRA